MMRLWMADPCLTMYVSTTHERNERTIAAAALDALIPKTETSTPAPGTSLRQTLGSLLIPVGQRLHGMVPHSTDMVPAASR